MIETAPLACTPSLGPKEKDTGAKSHTDRAFLLPTIFHKTCDWPWGLRDRTAEAMAYRASGLNLVVNAIILWNTTYLSRAVAYARGQGITLTDDALSRVAPVKWDHIALTGDYLWSDIETPRERFRPLRTNLFRPETFLRVAMWKRSAIRQGGCASPG